MIIIKNLTHQISIGLDSTALKQRIWQCIWQLHVKNALKNVHHATNFHQSNMIVIDSRTLETSIKSSHVKFRYTTRCIHSFIHTYIHPYQYIITTYIHHRVSKTLYRILGEKKWIQFNWHQLVQTIWKRQKRDWWW